jgi:hypothetical protein
MFEKGILTQRPQRTQRKDFWVRKNRILLSVLCVLRVLCV